MPDVTLAELEAEAREDISIAKPTVPLESIIPTGYVLVKELNIPIMMNKNRICTINNWSTIHWATKSKLKNGYKELLKEFFFSENDTLKPYCLLAWTPTYKDRRKHDSINLATVAKVIEDVITEVKAWDDDDTTSHILFNGSVDKSLKQHMVNLKIFEPID